ncbi:hypothetical protein AAMO2058_000737900 [Amorphochlora amoebiformis]
MRRSRRHGSFHSVDHTPHRAPEFNCDRPIIPKLDLVEAECTCCDPRGEKHSRTKDKRQQAANYSTLAINLIGFTVEFFWAVGEVVIMPLLELQGASLSEASFVMLLCPVLTLALHPLIGCWSDVIGRRIPMVLSGSFGTVALWFLVFQDTIIPKQFQYLVTIVSYGVAETAHDLLYTLGRAMTTDVAREGQGGLQELTSQFSAVMKLGRLGGFIVGVFKVEALFADRGLEEQSEDQEGRDTILHARILFTLVLILWVTSTCAVSLFVVDYPGRRRKLRLSTHTSGYSNPPSNAQTPLQQVFAGSGVTAVQSAAGEAGAMVSRPQHQNYYSSAPLPGRKSETIGGKPHGHPQPMVRGSKRSSDIYAIGLLWLMEYGNWIMDTVFCFYFVSVIGESTTFEGSEMRVGSFCLAAQSLVALGISISLPNINARLGSKLVWYAGNMSFALLCVAVNPLKNNNVALLIITTLTGFPEATRDNNVYVLLDKITPPGQEGYFVALVSNAMAAAQVTIGLTFGIITQYLLDNDVGKGFFYTSVISLAWCVVTILIEWSKGMIKETYG